MDLGFMGQVSTLVPEPARTPSAGSSATGANAPAPAADTSGDGSGNQNSGDPVQVSQPAGDTPEPWLDRTPTAPLVDRSFPISDRVARLDFKV